MKDRHRSGLYLALLTCTIWSVVPLIMRVAVTTISVELVVWSRFTIAGALFLAISKLRHRSELRISKQTFWVGLLAGVFLTLNAYLYTSGLHLAGPATAQILVQMYVPFNLVAGIVLFNERPGFIHWIGFGAAFFGFLYFYQVRIGGYENLQLLNYGTVYLVSAAASLTAYLLIHRYFSNSTQSEILNIVVFFCGSVLLFPIISLSELGMLSGFEILLLLLLGVFMVLGYGAFAEAVRRAPLTQTSVIVALHSLAMLLVMYVLHIAGFSGVAVEVLSTEGYVGAMVAVGGVVAISTRKVEVRLKKISR